MKDKTDSTNSITAVIETSIGQHDGLLTDSGFDTRAEKPRLLLHSCCGPCSTAVVERLSGEFNITVFFYNPCITDEEEYRKRRQSQIRFIELFNEERMHGLGGSIAVIDADDVKFMEGPYNPGLFLELCVGHEDDPEGGDRCSICFRQRLEKTAEAAGLTGCDFFGTTLTVSPLKSYKKISEIGRELAVKYGLSFLDRDFKKQDGFKRTVELSRKYGLYRQDYCGCVFSRRRQKE